MASDRRNYLPANNGTFRQLLQKLQRGERDPLRLFNNSEIAAKCLECWRKDDQHKKLEGIHRWRHLMSITRETFSEFETVEKETVLLWVSEIRSGVRRIVPPGRLIGYLDHQDIENECFLVMCRNWRNPAHREDMEKKFYRATMIRNEVLRHITNERIRIAAIKKAVKKGPVKHVRSASQVSVPEIQDTSPPHDAMTECVDVLENCVRFLWRGKQTRLALTLESCLKFKCDYDAVAASLRITKGTVRKHINAAIAYLQANHPDEFGPAQLGVLVAFLAAANQVSAKAGLFTAPVRYLFFQYAASIFLLVGLSGLPVSRIANFSSYASTKSVVCRNEVKIQPNYNRIQNTWRKFASPRGGYSAGGQKHKDCARSDAGSERVNELDHASGCEDACDLTLCGEDLGFSRDS
jgi:hypothetical protein